MHDSVQPFWQKSERMGVLAAAVVAVVVADVYLNNPRGSNNKLSEPQLANYM